MRIKGNSKRNILRGKNGDDVLLGMAGNDRLFGFGRKDRLVGENGDDWLDGGKGIDKLLGGKGNDTYIVDHAGDQVKEKAGQGIDTIRAAVSYVLGTNLENLVLTGNKALSGTGNALANKITGNNANNLIDGGMGADTLIGGSGDDIYMVDNSGDVVIEQANSGTDIVRTTLSTYALPANVEFIEYIGQGNFNVKVADAPQGSTGTPTGTPTGGNVTGGSGNDTVTGGNGDDTLAGGIGKDLLDGGLGIDKLLGGLGNDIYVVDNVLDQVKELLGEGTDLVKSVVDYVLGDNLEDLELLGSGNLNGTGNDLANKILGTVGDNVLKGAGGNDTLLGGAGADKLLGGAGLDQLTGGAGVDVFALKELGEDLLTDFNAAEDIIALDKGTFGLTSLLGNILGASEFATVVNDATAQLGATLVNPLAKILYSNETGKLFFDQNGLVGGLGSGGIIAQLGDPAAGGVAPVLSSVNFLVDTIA